LLLAGPGWVRKPGYPHAIVSSRTPTKPDVNLDCVLAAARVCAALSPQKISTTRL
jgi:hypothetical protein